MRRVIATANLPAAVADLTKRVVRKTRLWRSEQIEVARELTGHFLDGLEAGATPERLVERFGDAGQAAQMIRRARIRCRSWFWHARRWLVRTAAAAIALCAAFYLALAGLYLSSRPTISRDYIGELNTAAKAIPPEERAWPFYRAALEQLEPLTEDGKPVAADRHWWTSDAAAPPHDSPAWQNLATYVEQNRGPLAEVHRGAQRPKLGFVYGDPADRPFWQRELRGGALELRKDEPLYQIRLTHIQKLRELADLVLAEGLLAAANDDGETAATSLGTLISLAQHCRADGLLIEELVSFAVYAHALRLAADVLHSQPDLWTDEQLIGAAHRLAAYAGGGTLRSSLRGERFIFDDLLQRSFTDDGAGNGRLTPAGIQLFSEMVGPETSQNKGSRKVERTMEVALGPALMTQVGSRREQHDLAMRLFAQAEAERAGPLYTWEESTVAGEMKHYASMISTKIRYLPVLLLLPAVESTAMAGELRTQERDGLLTVIAVELYRRKHGAWPDTLDALVPRYLPELPLDRFTGAPLRYQIRSDRPFLYVCGQDRQDDGGRTYTGPAAKSDRDRFVIHGKPNPVPPPRQSYDWVLFPRQ